MSIFPISDNVFVENLIPQKMPFVMIDTLLSFSDKTVRSALTVKESNIFYHSNFFQEAGLIEHMAQSVAIHTGYSFYLLEKQAPVGYIGSISSLEIHRLPKLNENLETSVEIIQEFGPITLVNVEVKINGEQIASGQMKTVLA